MEDGTCPAQPQICEPFAFVRGGDGVSLRSALDEDIPAPASDVHCVLEAIRDGTRSTHIFTDRLPTVFNEAGAGSRPFRIRNVRVFREGHVEVTDSATESFPDPATPEPYSAYFAVRSDTFFEPCLASTNAEVLRDCLWEFEAEEVPESGCRAPVGAPARGGG